MRSVVFMSLCLPIAAHAGSGEVLTGTLDHSLPADPTGQIVVQNICGDVTVRGSEQSTVRIRGTVEDGAKLVVRSSGGQTWLEAHPLKQHGRGGHCVTLQLEVPRDSELGVTAVSSQLNVGSMAGDVELTSVSGDIQLGPGTQRAEIEAVSGSVRVAGVSREVEIEAVSGDVSVTNARGRVEIECVSGSIDVHGDLGRVDVESVSGSVTVAGLIATDGRVSIESHSGNVTLTVPPSSPGSFHLETFSGRLSAEDTTATRDRAGLGSSLRFARGTGGAHVSITTFSGNAAVKSRR